MTNLSATKEGIGSINNLISVDVSAVQEFLCYSQVIHSRSRILLVPIPHFLDFLPLRIVSLECSVRNGSLHESSLCSSWCVDSRWPRDNVNHSTYGVLHR